MHIYALLCVNTYEYQYKYQYIYIYTYVLYQWYNTFTTKSSLSTTAWGRPISRAKVVQH